MLKKTLKTIVINEIELEPIINGSRNGTRRGNYINIDSSGFQWITPSVARKLAKAILKMADSLEIKKTNA
jgi:hypothetical protein